MKPRWALYLDLIRFDRPAGWLLLLWPTLMSLWLAARGWPGWHLLAVFVGGTVLMRSAGCCINDVADREFDRHVKRTAQRPITSGQVSVKEALTLGAALALVALGLALTTHLAVVLWAIPAVLVTVAYPYAKRWVAMPQAVLGVAFSFGIPMAAVAVRASTGADAAVNAALSWAQPQAWQQAWAVATDLPAWVGWLALGNLCWVVAFDTQYAMVDRDDDLKIGIKTSAITLGRWDVAAVALLNGFWMLFWFLSIDFIDFNAIYFVVLAVSALQVLWHLWLIRGRERAACFKAFRLSHWLGLTWFVGVVLALL